jgi:lipid-binding SYLF domain-containing protein
MRSKVRRAALAALFCGFGVAVALAPATAWADTPQGQQELVDRAALAVNEVLGNPDAGLARQALPNARAVMICPRVFRVGIFFGGGEGGGCVLLARGAQGTWSAPAFYAMGGGLLGPQLGIQDAALVMLIMHPGALRAVMDNQFRLGGDASIAIVTLGADVQGATTAALNSDIVAFAKTRGLYGGISLQGSVMSSDSVGDEVYYGQPVGAVDIVMAMRVNNPGADPLRAALMRFGAPNAPPPQSYAAAPAYGAPQDAPPPPAYAPNTPVQQQELAPPR